jgi:predicted DNA-binding protein
MANLDLDAVLGKTPKQPKEMHIITLRITPEILQRLEAVSAAAGKPRATTSKLLLEIGIEECEKRMHHNAGVESFRQEMKLAVAAGFVTEVEND